MSAQLTPTSARGPPVLPSAATLRWRGLRQRQGSIMRLGSQARDIGNSQSTMADDGGSECSEQEFKYDKGPFPVSCCL